MKQALVEFIGTFFFVLVIGLTVIGPGAGNAAPLAIGAMLMVMVYAGGPISGGHYNPAVTLAVWMRRQLPTAMLPRYVGAQLVGAALAAALVNQFRPFGTGFPAQSSAEPILVAELLFTFALAYVVLNVTGKHAAGNSYFGLAIGMTVMAGAYATGNISGGVFNPAVTIAVTLMGISGTNVIWLYLLAQFVGAILAAGFIQQVEKH
jgi:aquaporin Z